MAPRHFAFMMLINLIWGFNLVAGKVGVTEFPPLLFTGLRFIVLALVLAPFLRIHRGQMPTVLGVSLTAGGLHFALLYAGLAASDDVSTVAILIQLVVPFATILSVLFLGERVGWRRWLGIALAFAGVMVIGFEPAVLAYLDGVALVSLGALSAATSFLLMKRLRGVGVFQLQAWVSMSSWPLLLGLSLLIEEPHVAMLLDASWSGWAAVLYTSLAASLIGHGGMYYLLQRYDVTQTAPLALLATVFAVIFGVVLLDDNLTARMIAGGLVTLAGVFILAVRRRRGPIVQPAATGSSQIDAAVR